MQVGLVAVGGDATRPDPSCVGVFGERRCLRMAARQNAPPTFIDRLATAGYNVSLYGKMHARSGDACQ